MATRIGVWLFGRTPLTRGGTAAPLWTSLRLYSFGAYSNESGEDPWPCIFSDLR